jgi:hypothetical protein
MAIFSENSFVRSFTVACNRYRHRVGWYPISRFIGYHFRARVKRNETPLTCFLPGSYCGGLSLEVNRAKRRAMHDGASSLISCSQILMERITVVWLADRSIGTLVLSQVVNPGLKRSRTPRTSRTTLRRPRGLRGVCNRSVDPIGFRLPVRRASSSCCGLRRHPSPARRV